VADGDPYRGPPPARRRPARPQSSGGLMLDLDMSPYAAFVWPAWGISALVIAALSARALIAARKWKRELAKVEAADNDIRRPQVAHDAPGQEK
jgi:heme exporter protein D